MNTPLVQKTTFLQFIKEGHLRFPTSPNVPIIVYEMHYRKTCLGDIYNASSLDFGIQRESLVFSSRKFVDQFIDKYRSWIKNDECRTFFLFYDEDRAIIESVTIDSASGKIKRMLLGPLYKHAPTQYATTHEQFVFPAKNLFAR
jgi:hypothetical protein